MHDDSTSQRASESGGKKMTPAIICESDVMSRERDECKRELTWNHGLRIIACCDAGYKPDKHITSALPNITATYLNSDWASLTKAKSGKVVQVGRDRTFGKSAVYPGVGEACTARCDAEIRKALNGADMAIVVAGLGGGVGSGAAPYVADVAKSMGIFTFDIVVLPFAAEAPRRAAAMEYLKRMKGSTNLTIAMDNENLHRAKGLGFCKDMDPTFGKSDTYPEIGEACSARCDKEIHDVLEGADKTIVLADLSRGVGSGAAPYVTEVAKSMGISTIGILILPFEVDASKNTNALDVFNRMSASTNLTIAINNKNDLHQYLQLAILLLCLLQLNDNNKISRLGFIVKCDVENEFYCYFYKSVDRNLSIFYNTNKLDSLYNKLNNYALLISLTFIISGHRKICIIICKTYNLIGGEKHD
ncbi:MAG: hypothetical protein V1934_01725 [Methanobacteriota archaeon]